MLFLWTASRRGKIWIEGEGLKQAVARRLPQDFLCQEVSFVGDQSLMNVYVSVPEKDDPKRRLAVVDRLNAFFRPLGIVPSVHYVPRTPEETRTVASPLYRNPLVWGGAAAALVALGQMGVRGIAWATLAGLSGFAVAWLALTEDGRKLVRQVTGEFRR
jgi:hypothetical protein